jgi:hypothetical protein
MWKSKRPGRENKTDFASDGREKRTAKTCDDSKLD